MASKSQCHDEARGIAGPSIVNYDIGFFMHHAATDRLNVMAL
nr:hypothetical protein [Neorhizobium tomejilense]